MGRFKVGRSAGGTAGEVGGPMAGQRRRWPDGRLDRQAGRRQAADKVGTASAGLIPELPLEAYLVVGSLVQNGTSATGFRREELPKTPLTRPWP